MNKTVLNLTAQSAKKFFLQEDSYYNFDLPPYFRFESLISALDKKIGRKTLDSCITGRKNHPRNYENVNYRLFGNKNGKYDWRKFQLIHPVLYILLVNTITSPTNWAFIVNKFGEYKKGSAVNCVSIPAISSSRLSNKGRQIKNWLQDVEQKSLELSLKYDYLYKTDISSYYGSIYTHSIAWALYGRTTAKAQKQDKSLIGNQIDDFMMAMSYGQTNGIPEGSVLMDFISEIVLGYADSLLTEKLKLRIKPKQNYQILRYRDDYRIFTNNPVVGDEIIKTLTEVLIELGLKINSSKTIRSQSVLIDSLKDGKLAWLESNLSELSSVTNYTKTLQILHLFSDRYPNSGTLVTKLTDLYKQLESQSKLKGNIRVIIAYVVDIAIKNPSAYPICTAILSKLLTFIGTFRLKVEIINDIYRKITSIPNTGFLEIWLQRVIINEKRLTINFTEKLCKIVEGNSEVLWESDWLAADIKNIIDTTGIIDASTLQDIESVIDPTEISPFIY